MLCHRFEDTDAHAEVVSPVAALPPPISIFEAMAEHAYMESWQTDPNWKVADTIEQQLNRPEGEGKETWKEMKSEVDHMIETGSVELAYRYGSEVQERCCGKHHR